MWLSPRQLGVRTMFRGARAQPPLEAGSLIYFSVIPPLLLHPPQSLQGQDRRGWGKFMTEPSRVLSGSWILPQSYASKLVPTAAGELESVACPDAAEPVELQLDRGG